jgi:hypothetical protein
LNKIEKFSLVAPVPGAATMPRESRLVLAVARNLERLRCHTTLLIALGGVLYNPKRMSSRYVPAPLLILLVAAIGIGSFIFYAVANRFCKPAENRPQSLT